MPAVRACTALGLGSRQALNAHTRPLVPTWRSQSESALAASTSSSMAVRLTGTAML